MKAVESKNVDLIASGREILLNHHFINEIENGKEDKILSKFDPNREDKHDLPPKLWGQLNDNFYLVPRTDGS